MSKPCNYGEQMTTEMPTERDRLDSVELESEAAIQSDEQPVRRTVTRFVVTAAITVVLVTLFVVALAQGLTSTLMSITGNSVCTGSDCVEVSLAALEDSTGVDFPDGTTVDSSSREENFLGDKSIHFEVRIPAGVPLPELEYPWESDTDSEIGSAPTPIHS
jgi:hypothetical protein